MPADHFIHRLTARFELRCKDETVNIGKTYISGNLVRRHERVVAAFPQASKESKLPNQIKFIAVVAALSIGTAAAAQPPKPRISMTHAKAMALKLAPGKIISSEYENEGGGWRYSFDIQQKGNVQEIGIDGRTGKVVENKSEGKVDHD